MKTTKLIVVAVMVSLGTSAAWAAPEDTVYFEDPWLKYRVEETLGKSNPTEADMLELTTLVASGRGIQSLVGLEYATNLIDLYLSRNKITGISPLADLTNLKQLWLGGNNIMDISPLTELMNLEYLNMEHGEISDISQYSEMTMLLRLNLAFNQISDVSPLGSLMNLKRLDIDHNQITDITPLDGLPNLEFLRVRNNQIVQVSLSHLPSLVGLDIVSNQITQITLSGSGLPNLGWITLGINQISDVSGLADVMSLGDLSLSYNQLSDISPLAGLTKLHTLLLDWNQLSDISPLAGLTNLEYLYAKNNIISDISPLAGLTKLYNLDLRNNQILDISPLAGLTNLYYLVMTENMVTHIPPLTGATQLAEIWLGHNQISDISGLATLVNIRGVDLSYNLISDIQPLIDNPEMDTDDTVVLNCNPLSGKAIITDIPILTDRGIDVIFDKNAECMDTDGDGLLDSWEMHGIDIDGDGKPELDLSALGANPLHKDLFVEVDAMVGLAPAPATLDRVVAAFAAAPNSLVENPDGKDGVTLHIDYVAMENDIPLADWPDAWAGFNAVKNNDSPYVAGGLGTREDRMNANWLNIKAAKKMVYRYCIFAKRYSFDCSGTPKWSSSGLAEWPGNDFMVTLGDESWQEPEKQERITDIQAGTFMHELGHNLNLHHGGGDPINYKPNYFSVMNYSWQYPKPNYVGWELDYSRVPSPGEPIPVLDEADLDEQAGIEGPAGIWLYVGPPPMMWVEVSEPVDWNRDDDTTDTGVSANINYLRIDPCKDPPDPNEKLYGHCDWPVLWYRLGGHDNFRDGVYDTDAEPEMTSEEYTELFGATTEINASIDFDPDVLSLASSGKIVTVYIELPQGFDVGDIDISTLKLNDSVAALLKPVDVNDYDLDGVPDLMVKFDRKEVAEVLDVGQQTVTLSGELADGTQFTGTDVIRVIGHGSADATESALNSDVSQDNTAPMQKKLAKAEVDDADIGGSEIIEVKEGVAFMLFEVAGIIKELGQESLNNEESAFELTCAINDVFTMLDEGMYLESLILLENDILQRMDGCANTGQPDEDDWITSIEGQALLYPRVVETIELLESML